MPNEELKAPIRCSRFLSFERELKEDANTMDVSFSSEQAVKRFDWRTGEYYNEILGHEPGNVDLARISEMGVTLFNHNADRVVGPFRNAELDTGKHECRGTVGFDSDEESQKIRNKVASGTLKGLSVGYLIKSWELVMAGEKSTCGRHIGPCRIARLWEPYEVSITPIPADPNVGIGRSMTDDILPEVIERILEERAAGKTGKVERQENAPNLESYQRELEVLEAEI